MEQFFNMEKYYVPAEDSFLLKKQVEIYVKENRPRLILDMGTGSGIQAIAAAKCSSSDSLVVAADLNRDALSYAKSQADGQGLKNLVFVRSDLFSNLKGKSKGPFDLIIFNPPYLPQDKEAGTDIAIYGGKMGHEVVERFLDDAGAYLAPKGRILLLFSSLTVRPRVELALAKNLFAFTQLASTHAFFEDLYVIEAWKSDTHNEIKAVKGLSFLKYVAKGTRGLLFEGRIGRWPFHKKVAIKTVNPTTKAIGRLDIEADNLEAVNKLGIGPKLYSRGNNHLIMEFIEGKRIIEFIKSADRKGVVVVLIDTFIQLRKLDLVGLEKGEMNRPYKHIIVKRKLFTYQPILIDFEKSRRTERPGNVTQFCHYLGTEDMIELLATKGIDITQQKMIGFAKAYIKDLDEATFQKILSVFDKSK